MNQKKIIKENWFKSILNGLDEAVLITDPQGLITSINAAAEKLIGWNQKEVLGKNIKNICKIIDKTTRKNIYESIDKVLKSGSISYPSNNILLITKDGKEIPVSEYITPVEGEKDKLIGMVHVVKNVTDEKNRIEHLRHIQKMEIVGSLARSIAHDVNNITTAIRIASEMIIMNMNDSNPIYQDMIDIQEASGRARDLTRQLLLFNRNRPIDLTPMNVNQIIQELELIMKRLIDNKIQIQLILDPELDIINGDQSSIQQIIINLVLNAQESMSEGGSLIIQTENMVLSKKECQEFTPEAPCKNVGVIIKYADSGINQEIQDRNNDSLFSSKEQSIKSRLPLVKYIIKQHSGCFQIKSVPNQGTTFKILFPIIQEKRINDNIETPIKNDLYGHGEKILLIDDEEKLLEYVGRALRKTGYQVFAAKNDEEAISLVNQGNHNFDLVICDMVMPSGSGVELVQELLSLRPDLKVVLSSGYSNSRIQGYKIQKEGLHFLQKPYNLNDLLIKIKTMIQK